jgi:hypothetical protein
MEKTSEKVRGVKEEKKVKYGVEERKGKKMEIRISNKREGEGVKEEE